MAWVTRRRPARGAGRVAAAVAAAVLGLPLVLLGSGAALATSSTLYAAPTGVGTQSCVSALDACTLTKALTLVHPGGTVQLTTIGSESNDATQYQGAFVVNTVGTSSSAPVSIVGPPGGDAILSASATYMPDLRNADDFLDLRNLNVQDSGVNSPGLANNDGGTVSISHTTFEDDSDTNGGGGIENGDVLVGGGVGGGTIDVSDSVFQSDAGTDGGAIDNVDGTAVVDNSTFVDNSSSTDGGAIANGLSTGTGGPTVHATLTVTGSTFTSNSTFEDGGAIDTGDAAGHATAEISDSLFDGNYTNSDDGGAIAAGIEYGTSTLAVSNSIFFENAAEGGNGGAIENGAVFGDGDATILHSTFLGNSVDGAGDIIDNSLNGTGRVKIGGNIFSGECEKEEGGTWTDLGYNVGDNSSCFGSGPHDVVQEMLASDLSGLEYLDDPAIEVIVPTAGSDAIGSIPAGVGPLCPIAGDVRGVPSPSDGPCDAGAVQDPGGATVLLTAAPLPSKPASVDYQVDVLGYYGVEPSGSVTIGDSRGNSCTIPNLTVSESDGATGTGACAVPGESAADGPYTVVATYNANHKNKSYGTSSASIVEMADVANASGTTSSSDADISVKATGGAPGVDTLTQAQYVANPDVAPLENANNYFDVGVSTGARFKTLSIKDCAAINSSSKVLWWSPTAAKKSKAHVGWLPVSGATETSHHGGATPCLDFKLSAKTVPDIEQLSGTSFGTETAPLRITASSLQRTARVRRLGRIELHATGGNAPYTWSLSSGVLPAGMTLSKKGVISGKPTATGSFVFVVLVQDTATSTHKQESATGTVVLGVHT